MRWQMKNGNWKMGETSRRMLLTLSICPLPFIICHLAGCTASPPSTQPDSISDRQDAALKDPMGYKPQVGGDTSASDIGRFDKDGFNHDLHDVLNP